MAATKLKEWFLKSKRTLTIGVFTVLILISSFIFSPVTFADGWWDEIVWKWDDVKKEEALVFLDNDWIQYGNILGMILQSLKGWIIQPLFAMVSSLEDLIPKTFSFFDLLEDTGLNSFAASIMKGLFYALLLLVIVWLAIKTIIQHKPPRFKSVVVNIIVMIGLIGGLNELMADMQKMATDFYEDTTNDSKAKEGLAFSIVRQNTADLAYLSTVGFGAIQIKDSDQSASHFDERYPKNSLSKEMYMAADLGDIISPDVVDKLKDQDDVAEETKFLAYRVTNNGVEEALESIEDSFFNPFKDTFPSGYIRYPMKFTTIFWGLASLGIAYLFTIFVFVMTIFEIAMKKIIAPIVFVTDIETGEKTKMVIQDIAKGFMLIGFTGLSLRFYTIAVNFLAGKDINAFLYIVAMICLTGALIKGSDSILKYFGVDVGLKEGKNNLMAAVGMLAAANGARKGVSNMFKSAKDKMGGQNKQTRDDTPKRSEMDAEDMENHQNEKEKGNKKSGITPKKFMKNTGAALSYASNRGVGGMMNDAGNLVAATVGGAVDKGKEKVTGVAKDVSDGVKGTIDEFKEGQAEGKQKAQENNDRQLLNRMGKDIHKNANSGTEQSANPKVEDVSVGNKQQVERELEVANRINNPGRNEVPNDQAKGDRQQVERELEVANRINNPGRNEVPNDQAKGDRQQVERELEVANRINNPGRNEVPNDQAKGDRQQVERELEVANRINNPGRNEIPNDQAKGDRQQVERQVEVANRLNNTGSNEVPNTQAKGENQRVERQVEVANRLNNTGSNEVPNTQAKVENQQVERQVNVADRLNSVGASSVSQNNIKPEASTVQREVNIQDNVKSQGSVNSGNVSVNGTTVQREVNVQDNVKNQGSVNSGNVSVNGTTVQREVNVQDNVKNQGSVNSGNVSVNGTTVQREVNVQDNVKNQGSVNSGNVSVNGTTVQREVNVQDNVRSQGTVSSGNVSVNGTTVQREVNVQDNVRSQGTVSSGNVSVNGTTVQREVNVQDNVRSQGTVSSGNVSVNGTTVQREVNVQDNVKDQGTVSSGNVGVNGTTVQREVHVQEKEVRASGLRQRGIKRNRTDQLRRN
ncbi:pLS20_p028 family conjugation system transmembrane protein [Bacillus thuringiensis]|uniref:Membrane protein n=2 Tax=Bacillus thuringiensis TaxID=1428 RepID=A0AB33AQ62_BACTU|nr:membrane protein [Bacillus thuringiensis]AJG73696.1 putative membrane protein [Bacillus thuringiensis]